MTEYSSIYIREIFILINALVSHTFDNSEFSSHMTEECTVNGAMTELYSPGVLLLVNYLCHFLLSSFYRGYSCVSSLRSCSRDKNLQLEDPTRSDEYNPMAMYFFICTF